MGINVSVISHSQACKEATAQAIRRALEICGGKAESYAKQLCPVDTGRLRNSITHAADGDYAEIVGTNVEYAPYVELGTRKTRAKPFIKPAAENHVEEYKSIIVNELSKL